MSKTFDIAVVGATGMVGESMLEILSERKFPIGKVHALASERSVGKEVSFGNRKLEVSSLAEFDFSNAQLGLFSAGASVSAERATQAPAPPFQRAVGANPDVHGARSSRLPARHHRRVAAAVKPAVRAAPFYSG